MAKFVVGPVFSFKDFTKSRTIHQKICPIIRIAERCRCRLQLAPSHNVSISPILFDLDILRMASPRTAVEVDQCRFHAYLRHRHPALLDQRDRVNAKVEQHAYRGFQLMVAFANSPILSRGASES